MNRIRNWRAVVAILISLWANRSDAQQTPARTADAPSWDTFADTWVATDALGRALPTATEAGTPKADRRK